MLNYINKRNNRLEEYIGQCEGMNLFIGYVVDGNNEIIFV